MLHLYVIASTVIFVFFFLVWNTKTRLNIATKMLMLSLAVMGIALIVNGIV